MPGVSLKKPKGFGCRVGTQQDVTGRLRCGRLVEGGGSLLSRQCLGMHCGFGGNFHDFGSVGFVMDVVVGECLACCPL